MIGNLHSHTRARTHTHTHTHTRAHGGREQAFVKPGRSASLYHAEFIGSWFPPQADPIADDDQETQQSVTIA